MSEHSHEATLAEKHAESARQAGLRYVSDERRGITRRRCGKGWCYFDVNGRRITDDATLRRIRALAIPPAYTRVWICPDPLGHIQATARDAKGRKQYRYHPRWREVRDAVKYDRMIAFAEALPKLRERCNRDLARPGLCREKVLAAVVQLLEQTKIRVGNEEYARKNRSFGLTTLLSRHVAIDGAEMTFSFRGKSGKHHAVKLRDRRLARVVRRCLEIPGQELFSFVVDGHVHVVTSGDVNDYLREVAAEEGRALSAGEGFTAKDFRTWAGTVMAADELRRCCPGEAAGRVATKAQLRRAIKCAVKCAIERVSLRLGNTPAVCRKSYVHPSVVEAYENGRLGSVPWDPAPGPLHPEERFTLALLRLAGGSTTLERALVDSLAAKKLASERARKAA